MRDRAGSRAVGLRGVCLSLLCLSFFQSVEASTEKECLLDSNLEMKASTLSFDELLICLGSDHWKSRQLASNELVHETHDFSALASKVHEANLDEEVRTRLQWILL